MDVVEPEKTEWASLMVFLSKEYGTLQLSVDYRKLNVVIIRYSYPKAPMGKCIDSLGDVTILCTLHNSCSY